MSRLVTLQPGFTLGDFNALLATRQFVIANLFTITASQGAVVRLCDLQENVSVVAWNDVNRHIYYAREAVVEGLKAESTVGMETSEQDITIGYNADALFQGWQPWAKALLLGRLDGALISRDWAIAPREPYEWESDVWVGVTRMFSGYVAELDSVGRTQAKLKVKSDLERLNVQVPRDLYQPRCKNVFGDFRCGVDLNSLAVLGTVGLGATRDTIPWASAGANFSLGKIHITNGDTVTRVRTIRKADSTNLYLSYPLDFDPASGLQFTAFPGCTRLLTGANGCQTYHPSDYKNRFGGFPFVPVAETAI
jgi:hypothetical protein